MDKKWCITGYSIETVAGTEESFDFTTNKGFTSSAQSDWAKCVDTTNIGSVYDCIAKTINRAIKMANIENISKYNVSLIISSNFFESSFWEGNNEHKEYIMPKLELEFKINGLIVSDSTACASGASAIVTACQILDDKISDICIVLGYDIESDIPKNGMKRLGALSKQKISPFSLNRTGTDLADGIGVLIIENSAVAHQRKAIIHSEIVGFGVNNDAYNPTSPDPIGTALTNATKSSITMAGISAHQINYINSHGSGTKLNDLIETNVIKEIFKDYAYKLLINSSKSIIGHTLGAAGIIEIVLTIMQMNRGIVHPTANFSEFDKDCDLNYCLKKAVACDIKYAISNSIGFGGTNVSVLLKNGGEL